MNKKTLIKLTELGGFWVGKDLTTTVAGGASQPNNSVINVDLGDILDAIQTRIGEEPPSTDEWDHQIGRRK